MRIRERANRIVLLGRSLLRVVLRGRATQVPAAISRVIVVPTGKLGDVVCATPVLRAIRAHLPQARIIVAGNSKLHQGLLNDSGLADEYLNLDEPGAIERVRLVQADAAFVTGPSFVPAAQLCAAGVPLVVAASVEGGFSPSETRLFKILKKRIKTFPYHIESYAPRERLRVLESVGIITEDTKKLLGFTTQADQKIKDLFARSNVQLGSDFVVGISPTAGNKIKEWPVERFAAVADHLVQTYKAKIVLIGGPQDKVEVQAVIEKSRLGKNFVTATDLSIDELKALISKLNMFVAVDTGPIYIAEAFDVPTVDIVGPVDERVQPPRGRFNRNVLPPGRARAELSILNARMYNEREASNQVLSTTVEMVVKVIDQLIADLKARS